MSLEMSLSLNDGGGKKQLEMASSFLQQKLVRIFSDTSFCSQLFRLVWFGMREKRESPIDVNTNANQKSIHIITINGMQTEQFDIYWLPIDPKIVH